MVADGLSDYIGLSMLWVGCQLIAFDELGGCVLLHPSLLQQIYGQIFKKRNYYDKARNREPSPCVGVGL